MQNKKKIGTEVLKFEKGFLKHGKFNLLLRDINVQFGLPESVLLIGQMDLVKQLFLIQMLVFIKYRLELFIFLEN